MIWVLPSQGVQVQYIEIPKKILRQDNDSNCYGVALDNSWTFLIWQKCPGSSYNLYSMFNFFLVNVLQPLYHAPKFNTTRNLSSTFKHWKLCWIFIQDHIIFFEGKFIFAWLIKMCNRLSCPAYGFVYMMAILMLITPIWCISIVPRHLWKGSSQFLISFLFILSEVFSLSFGKQMTSGEVVVSYC